MQNHFQNTQLTAFNPESDVLANFFNLVIFVLFLWFFLWNLEVLGE